MDNEEVGRAFVCAGKQEQPLDVSSLSELQISYFKAIYGHLRALTENFRKAAKIVRPVKGDNGLEAWRRLARKFDPQNLEVHAAQLENIVNFGKGMRSSRWETSRLSLTSSSSFWTTMKMPGETAALTTRPRRLF